MDAQRWVVKHQKISPYGPPLLLATYDATATSFQAAVEEAHAALQPKEEERLVWLSVK